MAQVLDQDLGAVANSWHEEMGSTCCKDTSHRTDLDLKPSTVGTDKDDLPLANRKEKHVSIRRTVQSVDIGFDSSDVEARHGADDPDLDQLYRDAEARKAAKAAKKAQRPRRPSVSEGAPQEIPRNQDEPVIAAKRCQGRKGTGFVKKSDLPEMEDAGDGGDEAPEGSKKRCKGRKGTGFARNVPPPEDDDDDDEEEAKPRARSCKDRKATGAIKKGTIPVDDGDDDEED